MRVARILGTVVGVVAAVYTIAVIGSAFFEVIITAIAVCVFSVMFL